MQQNCPMNAIMQMQLSQKQPPPCPEGWARIDQADVKNFGELNFGLRLTSSPSSFVQATVLAGEKYIIYNALVGGKPIKDRLKKKGGEIAENVQKCGKTNIGFLLEEALKSFTSIGIHFHFATLEYSLGAYSNVEYNNKKHAFWNSGNMLLTKNMDFLGQI